MDLGDGINTFLLRAHRASRGDQRPPPVFLHAGAVRRDRTRGTGD
jgi:hypothetical protein